MTIHSDKVYFLNQYESDLIYQLKNNVIIEPTLFKIVEEYNIFLKKTTGFFAYFTGSFILTRMIGKYYNQKESEKIVLTQEQMIVLIHHGLFETVINKKEKYFSTLLFFLLLKGTSVSLLTNHTLNQYYSFLILKSVMMEESKQSMFNLLLQHIKINPYFDIQASFNEEQLPATLLVDYYFKSILPNFNDSTNIISFQKYHLNKIPNHFEQIPFKNTMEDSKYLFILFIKSFHIKRKNRIQFLNIHKQDIFDFFYKEFNHKPFTKKDIKPFYKKVLSVILNKRYFPPISLTDTPPIILYSLKKELNTLVNKPIGKLERTPLISNIYEKILEFSQFNIVFSYKELLHLAYFINDAISKLPGITEFLPQLCQEYFKTSLTEFYANEEYFKTSLTEFYANEEYFKRAVLPTEEHSLQTEEAYLLLKQLKPVYLENIQNYELTCI
jgi:hypothetical protein